MATLTETPVSDAKTATPVRSRRLVSLDALRGFDMFWIIGADSLVYALHRMKPNPVTNFLADQLEHTEWAGFHFYDLIFPLFIFIMGVALVFSLDKLIATHGRAAAVKRIFLRSVLLYVLGVFYGGGLAHAWPDVRLSGVLNRIAFAYFFAGLLYCFFRPRALVAIAAAILLGYWALLAWVPVRNITLTKEDLAAAAAKAGDQEGATALLARGNPSGEKDSRAWAAAQKVYYGTTAYVTGRYDKGLNLACAFDFEHLPGRKYETFYDAEGFLSTPAAVVTCLLGVFAGLLLKRDSFSDHEKVKYLLYAGIAAVVVGWTWNLGFPVVKRIWTSSFVLVAGGYSALLLAAFYWIIEVRNWRGWCQPFIWMGMNSITVYIAAALLGGGGFRQPGQRLVGGDIRAFFDQHVAAGTGDLVISLVGLLLAFWFVRILYRRQVFLRL